VNLSNYLNEPSPVSLELRTFFRNSDSLVILDIGACEGEDSIRYKIMFKNAIIFSFEPLPFNVLKMKENFARYNFSDKIEIIPIALSDREGVADFYVSSGAPPQHENNETWNYGNKSSSLLEPATATTENIPWLNFKEKIIVKLQRIDSFIREKNLHQIDFIHMDVQGAELMVLRGAGSSLHHIKCIWMEVENIELYKSQPVKQDVEKYMHDNGFIKLVDTVSEITGDQFYINRRMVSTFTLNKYKAIKFAGYLQQKVTNHVKRLLRVLS
jgi:FkbM family methyltransferase